jgi:hypothetical protein
MLWPQADFRIEETERMRGPLRGAVAAIAATSMSLSAAAAQTLHVTYAISLLGLPLGAGQVKAELTPASYAIEANAKLNALASLVNNSHGVSQGHGAIVAGHVSPAAFATTASSSSSTRTIRMAIKNNSVAAVDIAPPFTEKPDRVPLRPEDTHNIVDPVAAYVFPAAKLKPEVSAADCDRTLPIFDGYTRFNLKLSFVEQRKVKAKGYEGEVAVCAVRYEPIAGHRSKSWGTKFMEENRDIQIWLAPVAGAAALAPYKVAIKTAYGMLNIEATEFSVSEK